MKQEEYLPTEDQEQIAFVEYLRLRHYKFTHIANQGKFPVQYRNKLKRMGVDAGVPDLMIIHPKGYLVFVEMKRRKKSRASDEQLEWILRLSLIPHVKTAICYGYEEAKEFIDSIA